MQTVTIPSARQPAHVMVLASFLVYGLVSIFAYSRIATNSIRQFPEPWGRAFILGISIGAALVLWAALRNTLDSIVRFERAGHWLLIAMFVIYAMWSIDVNGSRGFGFTVVLVAMAGASAWRLLQIRAFLKAVKSAVARAEEA